jgi:hypothetical protein
MQSHIILNNVNCNQWAEPSKLFSSVAAASTDNPCIDPIFYIKSLNVHTTNTGNFYGKDPEYNVD